MMKFRPARKVERSGDCLEGRLGEIAMAVKMRPTYTRTKRPRGALLQLGTGGGSGMRRIGGRLRSRAFGLGGANLEIPLFPDFASNV